MEDLKTDFKQGGAAFFACFKASWRMVALTWKWATEDSKELLGRFIVIGFVVFIAAYMAAQYNWLWAIYGLIWFLACCWIVRQEGLLSEVQEEEAEEEEADYSPEQDQLEGRGEAPETNTPDPEEDKAQTADKAFINYVEACVAEAVAQGRKGIHLRTILGRLQEPPNNMLPDWDVPRLRTKFEALNIPIKEQLYIKGTNTLGIHVDDLSAYLERTPQLPPGYIPPPEAAQQPAHTAPEPASSTPRLTLVKDTNNAA